MSETSINESARATVGSILRNARELKGMKLEDAAAITRISKAYLSALEEGLFDRLPNEAYVKGFIRAYARFLELSEQEVMAAYVTSLDEDLPTIGEEENSQEIPPSDVPNTQGGRRRLLPLLIPLLLLAAAIVLFLLKGEKNLPEREVVSSGGGGAHAGTPSPAGAVPEPATQTAPPAGDSTEKAPLKPSAPAENGMVLRLKAVEDASLEITIDGAATQHYDLKAGDLIEWKGEKGFSLDLENAGGVEAELNGKVLAPLGSKGVRAHVELGYEGDERESAP